MKRPLVTELVSDDEDYIRSVFDDYLEAMREMREQMRRDEEEFQRVQAEIRATNARMAARKPIDIDAILRR